MKKMIKHDFPYVISESYFPGYKVTSPYHCMVFYVADSLGNPKLTMIGFDPKMPMMNNILYKRLIAEIEQVAKEHYDSLNIEQQEYNDSEMQEKYFS
jgi:hypothetical protein